MARVVKSQLVETEDSIQWRMLAEDGQNVTLVLTPAEAMTMSGKLASFASRNPSYMERVHPGRARTHEKLGLDEKVLPDPTTKKRKRAP